MKSKHPFALLSERIQCNPNFDSAHKHLLNKVVHRMHFDNVNEVNDVSEQIKAQIAMEASMVYLLGEYRDAKELAELELEREEALALEDVLDKFTNGCKPTQREISSAIRSHPSVAILRERFVYKKSLFDDLNHLFWIVTNRNKKLEHLSNNYRKELDVDSRA